MSRVRFPCLLLVPRQSLAALCRTASTSLASRWAGSLYLAPPLPPVGSLGWMMAWMYEVPTCLGQPFRPATGTQHPVCASLCPQPGPAHAAPARNRLGTPRKRPGGASRTLVRIRHRPTAHLESSPRAASGRPRGAPTRHLRALARVADETNCTTGAAHVRESRTGCAGRPVTSSTSPTVRQHASCPGTSAPSIAVLEPPGAAVRLSDNATGFPLRRRQRQLSCDEAWCRDVVVSPAATPNCRCDYVLPLLVVNKGGCAARATGAQRSDQ